jgi:hypothetical protein
MAALALGLMSILCLGPLAGVPAILLGGKVVREALAGPHQYQRPTAARAGVAFGWIGSFGWMSYVFYRVASESIALTILFLVLGVATAYLGVAGGRSNVPAVAATGRFVRKQRAMWMVSAALCGAGTLGAVRLSQSVVERTEVCTAERDDAAAALATNDFGRARSALENAKTNCASSKEAEIVAALADITTREAAFQKAQVEQLAAQQAQAAAAREKAAVDGFPALPKQVNDLLAAANTKMAQGKWKDAEATCLQARAALDADQGTSVAATKDWSDLDKKVAALDQKVQPQIARIAQQEAA